MALSFDPFVYDADFHSHMSLIAQPTPLAPLPPVRFCTVLHGKTKKTGGLTEIRGLYRLL
jgi:hypothetical protein